jgi:transposase
MLINAGERTEIEHDSLTARPIMMSCPHGDLDGKTSLLELDSWQSIRWLHYREGRSIRWISKEFGIARRTVAKYLKEPDSPKYSLNQPRPKPVTGQWREAIEKILESDKEAPRKQRHTAKRIFERLVEAGYEGSDRSVRQLVAEIKNKPASKASVPLIFQPGKDAQVDFGESYAKLGGDEVKLHGFEMRLNFSRKKFVAFFQSTDKEAFLEGHVRAFRHFQGVVERISYDNLGAAVGQMGKGKHRELTKEFKELKGYYNFKTNFCKPGEEGAHEKGGVENGVGFARRNWMVPVPEFDTLDELNAYLLDKCRADDARTVSGQSESISAAWQKERQFLLPLPAKPFDPAVQQTGMVDSYCTLPFKTNHYSVPPQYVGKVLTIRSYWNRIEISTGLEKVADHRRSYARDEYILRPEHYLDLLERRPHAIPYARPLVQHEWPDGYWDFYQRMVASVGPSQAGRDFIRILRCHVKHGGALVSKVLARVAESDSANADMVIAAIDRDRFHSVPAEPVDLSKHPELAACRVVMFPEPSAYTALTSGGSAIDHIAD